ncbi:hypothetical protein LG3211_1103 [Lysobacter gummosus]|nr:hypothetical protein LG3211_1103 [Lysobacter gummosus]
MRSCSHSLSAPSRRARKSGSTRPRIAPARFENPAEKSAISKRDQGARIAVADASAAHPTARQGAARRRRHELDRLDAAPERKREAGRVAARFVQSA